MRSTCGRLGCINSASGRVGEETGAGARWPWFTPADAKPAVPSRSDVSPRSAPNRVRSGFVKLPVAGPVAITTRGVAGDEQADLSVHGDAAKAVYGYAGGEL